MEYGLVCAVALLSLFILITVPSVYAEPSYCDIIKANLDKVSSAGLMIYQTDCLGIPLPESIDPKGVVIKPSAILPVGANIRINANPIPPTSSFTHQSEVSIDSCGNSVVAGYNDQQGGISQQVGYSFSLDNGATWTDAGGIPNDAGNDNRGDPSVKADSNCNFYYATLVTTPTASAIGVAKSVDGGQTFSTPELVDQSTTLFLDKEHIAVSSNPLGGPDIVHISYAEFNLGVWVQTSYARSLDGGLTWQDHFIFDPQGASIGAIPVVDPNTGTVYVFVDDFVQGAIRVYKNTNSGAPGSWLAGVNVASINRVGPSIDCDPNPLKTVVQRVWNGNYRVNEFPTAAVNPVNGEVYVAWNNAEQNGGATTDIVFFRSTNGGVNWAQVATPHPALPNNDQFLPWMDLAPDGEIKMIWYDRRNDPNNLQMEVFASSSKDGGQTWQQPNVLVSTVPFVAGNLITPDKLCYFIGEYNGLDTPNTSFAHAAWGDGRVLATNGEPQVDVFYARLLQDVQPVCGNGVPEGNEQCDDGNQSNTDACLNSCTDATCGDTFVWQGMETCDDGNTTPNDGCDAQCMLEPVPVCGDGKVEGNEQCEPPNVPNVCDAQCMFIFVGGEFLGVDSTALLIAGAQANALWLIPAIVAAVSIGIVIARKF